MEEILFCKDLHDPLENKGEKSTEKKDEEWIKMNRKTIGLIRQCIGYEVFHYVTQETSAYDLWTKLEKMYQAKTSRNMALLMRRLMNLKLQRGTVAEYTSSTASEFFTRELGDIGGFSQQFCIGWEVDYEYSQGCPVQRRSTKKRDGHDRAKDKKMFSTYAACEGLVRMANNTTNKVVGKGTVQFRMADGRSVTLTEVRHVPKLRKNLISIGMLDSMGCSIAVKGGILRISKGNKEMLRGRKTRGLYRLEGNVQTERDAVRHGSSDIRRKNGQGKQQDVHRKVQRKETKSILKSCTSISATSPKRVSFALDLISGRGARHLSEKVQALQSGSALPIDEGKVSQMQSCRSYGGAGSEGFRKDNLKTSDYPPMGWRGEIVGSSPSSLSKKAPKESKTETLPPSSMVNNGGMNELSHELILSALRPIN
ncbi:hypothetical protein Acr_29g0006800 [Actinidia rufa]|uniref:Retrovirus-related Pol polyprotein from transposon TNT 1-94-like beta-barrel domain-containing protein n=1 Tax=Actinidia rufa TaxID=165716 RepID=A0A7J0HEP7_9ERIC|nr:hypothetical protein Acr_29g0006800 [Actinidia rufa]